MTQQLSPGTQVQQVPNGPVVTPGIAVALAGMLCFCASGPVGVPLICNNASDGSQQFGGRITSPGNGRMTDNLIDYYNEGGQATYVMRYIGEDSAVGASDLDTVGAATPGEITSSTGAFPIALESGTTFSLSVSGAGALTATVTANQASATGSGATYAAVTAGHTLELAFFGVPTQTVTFAGTENSLATFLEAINDQIDGGHALAGAGGQIEFRTDIGGTSSAGEIITASADVLASLGITAGTHFALTGGSNVANNTQIQATEMATIFTAAFTGSTWTGNNTTGVLEGQTTATGAGTSLQFTGGAYADIPGFDNALHSGSTTGPIETLTLTAAMGQYPSPGSYINDWSRQATQVNTTVTTPAAVAAGTYASLTFASTARLKIGDQVSITTSSTVRGTIRLINGNVVTFVNSWVVPSGGYVGTESVVLETWNLSIFDQNGNIVLPTPFTGMRMSPLAGANYFVNLINSAARTPVTATDLMPSVPSGDARPSTDATPVLFSGGADGSAPTASDVVALFTNNAWNQAADVNFISAPGLNTDFTGADGVAVLQAQQAYVVRRDDVMAILSTPQGTPPTGDGGVADYIQNTANLASSLEAIYSPWITSLDAVSGNIIPFPPEPHVLGIIARTYSQANIAASPAGVPGSSSKNGGQVLSRPNGLEWYVAEQGPEYNEAYPAGANFILNLPGYGICVYGAQTLDSTGNFKAFNVQAVLNIAKRVAKLIGRVFVFQNINPTTNASLTRRLGRVFSQWRKSLILQGSSDPEAYYVVCNNTNNTPATIATNTRYCRIGLAIEEPAVFQSFTLELAPNPADGGAQVSITSGTAGTN